MGNASLRVMVLFCLYVCSVLVFLRLSLNPRGRARRGTNFLNSRARRALGSAPRADWGAAVERRNFPSANQKLKFQISDLNEWLLLRLLGFGLQRSTLIQCSLSARTLSDHSCDARDWFKLCGLLP